MLYWVTEEEAEMMVCNAPGMSQKQDSPSLPSAQKISSWHNLLHSAPYNLPKLLSDQSLTLRCAALCDVLLRSMLVHTDVSILSHTAPELHRVRSIILMRTSASMTGG